VKLQPEWPGKTGAWGLEEPNARHCADLENVKKTAVIFVRPSQNPVKEPRPIRRHVIHRVELITHKRGRHETDTFLRKLCTNRVDLAKCGRQPVEAITTANCPLNSSLLIIAGSWGRRHDFPGEGNSVLGIQSEQGVQEGRTAAWQTNDEQRVANFLSHDAWIRLPIPLHEQ